MGRAHSLPTSPEARMLSELRALVRETQQIREDLEATRRGQPPVAPPSPPARRPD